MQSTEEFKNKIKTRCEDDFELIGEYIGDKKNIRIKHISCGREFDTIAGNFIIRKCCPICNKEKNNKKLTKTQEQFKEDIKKVWGNEYTVLGDYENANEKIKIRHNECGNEYFAVPYVILKGKGCRPCGMKRSGMKQKKSHETFVSEVFGLVKNEYTVLEKYVNDSTKILFRHNECWHEYYVKPTNFINGKRCPKCLASKGEKKIDDYLKKINISYKRQYRIKQCKKQFPLPFDFAVFKNKALLSLIEYDGEQHFKPTWGEENFRLTTIRDQIKTNYCKTHNIPLLRIPYTEFDNIEQILDNHLKSLKII